MNLASLAIRLKGDLLRSPKKAAILGILILVAFWFWAPLLAKLGGKNQMPKAEATPITVAPPNAAGTSGAAAQATVEKTVKPKLRSWTELLSAVERDGRMRPATLDDGFVSPFTRVEPKSDEALTQAKTDTGKPPEVHPAQLGLVLTSTLVGPRSRLATIKGETYRQGDVIHVGLEAAAEDDDGASDIRDRSSASARGVLEADDDTQASGPRSTAQVMEFCLEKIQPNYVILTRQAMSYRLDLQRRAGAGRAGKMRVPERQVN